MSPELQGVLAGGAIGLATAALGHGFAWLKLKSKRAFDLRQTVYLEAATATANSLRFFETVSMLDIDDRHLADDIHPVAVSMFKIHVVGTPATIAALSSANHSLTLAASDLSHRRVALRAATAEATEARSAESYAEVARLHRELVREAMRFSLLYQRDLVEMNIAVRRELGLPLDETLYRDSNVQAEGKIAAVVEKGLGHSDQ